jgi:O-methyltransferase involved in polyketide biosynthesis
VNKSALHARPQVRLGFKETVLARLDAKSACERIVVPADLRGPWQARLTAAGFDRDARTTWLAEGLLL